MSNNNRQKALDRVARALVDNILDTDMTALLAEIDEDGGDRAGEARRLKGVYGKALAEVGKSRLATAKAAVAEDRASRRIGPMANLYPALARSRLEAALLHDPETKNKLTLAARKGEGLSDADVLSVLEDLEALGIPPPEENEGGST